MSPSAELLAPAGVIDVVLVEDSDDDALLVRKRLGHDGFRVTHVTTLAEALPELAVRAAPLCVLLDLSLPDADGLEGIERLQTEAPAVPVVVLTGNDDETVGLAALAAGAQDYLVKDRIGGDAVERAIRYSVERKHTAGVLSEARERFRRTFEDGPLGIALIGCISGQTRVVEANRALAAILGVPAERLVGRSVEDFTHWEDREAQAGAIEAFLSGEADRYSTERRLIHASGQVVWCTVTGSAVRDARGELLYAIALVEDITGRKLEQEALREAHQAMDHAVLGIAFIALSGRARTVNAFYAATLGYEPQELIGLPWTDVVHASDQDAMREAIGRVIAGEQATVEVRGVCKDGSTIISEVVLVPNTGADGGLNGYFHFMRDVTDRHRERQALEESEARYRRIIETSNDGVWTVDAAGATTFVNERMAELLGCAPGDMLGRSFLDYLHPSEHGRAEAAFRLRAAQDAGATNDYRFVREDGADVWFMVSVAPLTEHGELLGALAMVSDVTDRKRVEAEMQRLALHDELTGLPNRALLEDRLRRALSITRGANGHVAAFFIDLDRFKTINDGFGHDVGDELLRAVAPRLASELREHDTLARFGGDEFVVLCEELQDAQGALAVADRMLQALSVPIELSIGPVTSCCSSSPRACPRRCDPATPPHGSAVTSSSCCARTPARSRPSSSPSGCAPRRPGRSTCPSAASSSAPRSGSAPRRTRPTTRPSWCAAPTSRCTP